jgi:hypothetical protein
MSGSEKHKTSRDVEVRRDHYGHRNRQPDTSRIWYGYTQTRDALTVPMRHSRYHHNLRRRSEIQEHETTYSSEKV